ncbi:MAG: HAD family phosphatase [Clostridiales bacterium]|nr:HAD family phosphatase [Clostridiales bacterium]
MLKNYHYAIFDMDGTLIDSMPYWNNLGRDYLIDQGKTPEPNLRSVIAPMSLEESARYFQTYYGVEGTVSEIMEGINARMVENYRIRVSEKPGAREYLEYLQSKGVTMCLTTATSSHLAESVLQRLNLRHFFTDLISCDEVGLGKNHPDVFLLSLNRLQAAPEDTMVYEDAPYAIETANSLGLHTFGVFDASCKKTAEEMTELCEVYAAGFPELMKMIKESDSE